MIAGGTWVYAPPQPVLDPAHMEQGGKRYLCFLSHHKGGCAVEARFIKEEIEPTSERREARPPIECPPDPAPEAEPP